MYELKKSSCSEVGHCVFLVLKKIRPVQQRIKISIGRYLNLRMARKIGNIAKHDNHKYYVKYSEILHTATQKIN